MSDPNAPLPYKLYLRTWPLSIAIGILGTLLGSLCFGWGVGSPEQSVVLVAGIAVSLLLISVLRSRGRFRLTAILILMLVVSLFSAMIGRSFVLVQNQKRVIEKLVQRDHKVRLAGASRKEEMGWLMTRGGYAIPGWFRPAYNYFANSRIIELTIPADMLTMSNLHDLRLDHSPREGELWQHELTLEGEIRDPKALVAFSKCIRGNLVYVRASHLTAADVDYLSQLRGVAKIVLTLESPDLDSIAMCQSLDLANLTISKFKMQDTLAPFALRPNLPIVVNESRLTAELAKGLLRETEELQVMESLIEPAFLDEIARMNILRKLMILRCNLKKEIFQSLSQSESILDLVLYNTVHPNDILEDVAKMKQLKKLRIDAALSRWENVQELTRKLELEYLYVDVSNPPKHFEPNHPLLGPNIRKVLLEEDADQLRENGSQQ